MKREYLSTGRGALLDLLRDLGFVRNCGSFSKTSSFSDITPPKSPRHCHKTCFEPVETSKVNDGARNAGHRRSLTSDSVSLRQSSPKAPAHFLGSHSSLSHVVLHRSIIDYVHPRSPKSSRRDSGQNMRPARTDRQRAQTVPLPGRRLGKHLRRHICPRGQFQVLTRSTFSTELLPLRSRKPPRKNQPTYLLHKIPPESPNPENLQLRTKSYGTCARLRPCNQMG